MSTPRSYHFLNIISIIGLAVLLFSLVGDLGLGWYVIGAAMLGAPVAGGSRPPEARSDTPYRREDALDRLAADYLAQPDADALDFILAADELRPVGGGYLPPVSANDRARARAINAYHAKRARALFGDDAGDSLDSVRE